MIRSAPCLLLLLLPILAACSAGEESPEDVVAGFLEALNSKNWDEMMARLSAEARAKVPEDPTEEMLLRNRVFSFLVTAGGRIHHEESEHRIEKDGRAAVPTLLEVRRQGFKLSENVTFRLAREDGAWKLLPAVELESGHVVDNPLDVIAPRKPRRAASSAGGDEDQPREGR
jgi:hypothetical protein